MNERIVSFIRNMYKTTDFIPTHEPHFTGNEKKYLNDCIDSTFVSSVGKYVNLFEKKVAEYTDAKYAIATVNGTSALHIALLLAGVKSGDEVITQPLTFVATANAIKYCGADPMFIDVDLDTMGLSPEKLEGWIKKHTSIKRLNSSTLQLFNKNSGCRISAVVPMHTFGHPCRIDEIVEICNKYNLPVIEDAAESLGSFYKGQHTGTFGKMGVLSFNGNKIITTGGGGMIITDDKELAKQAKYITTQAKVPHKWEFIHDKIGYNYRMPNINAALGVAQMEQLETYLINKRQTASLYEEFFENLGIRFFSEPKVSRSNYWLNGIILEDRKERDEFIKFTNKNGVMTRPVWSLMNKLEMFKDCQKGDLVNAEWLEDKIVNIPSSYRV